MTRNDVVVLKRVMQLSIDIKQQPNGSYLLYVEPDYCLDAEFPNLESVKAAIHTHVDDAINDLRQEELNKEHGGRQKE